MSANLYYVQRDGKKWGVFNASGRRVHTYSASQRKYAASMAAKLNAEGLA